MEEKITVTLEKIGDFVFDEGSYRTVDKSLFDTLVDARTEGDDGSEGQPKMVFFKDKVDYANNAWKCNIDASKPIYVNEKNQIFCFRG